MVDVYIDEKFVGTVESAKDFIAAIKDERRKNKLPSCLNIEFDKEFNEVYIHLSTGRARRPLIIVENGVPKLTPEIMGKLEKNEMTFKDLIEKGIAEYLDANEEENAYVSL